MSNSLFIHPYMYLFMHAFIRIHSFWHRDAVRECLETDPANRTEDDVEILLEFTQHLRAFSNMTLSVRRALCSVMVSGMGGLGEGLSDGETGVLAGAADRIMSVMSLSRLYDWRIYMRHRYLIFFDGAINNFLKFITRT